MKKKNLLPVVVMIILAGTLLTSCKKSNEPAAVSSFTWVYGGTNYTANIKLANLSSRGGGPIIVGGMGTSTQISGIGPSIKVQSLAEGTYNFGLNTPNFVSYTDEGGVTLYSNAGTLQITQYANAKVSGNFTGTVLDVNQSPVPLMISFANVRVEN